MLYFDVGIDTPVDLAITQLELPNYRGVMQQVFGEGETFTFSAVVNAVGKSGAFTINCQVANLKAQQQIVHVQPGEQAAVTFEIETAGLKPGQYQAEVKLEIAADLLPFNNQRYVTFEIRKMPKILVLADDLKKAKTFVNALKAHRYVVDEGSAT